MCGFLYARDIIRDLKRFYVQFMILCLSIKRNFLKERGLKDDAVEQCSVALRCKDGNATQRRRLEYE